MHPSIVRGRRSVPQTIDYGTATGSIAKTPTRRAETLCRNLDLPETNSERIRVAPIRFLCM